MSKSSNKPRRKRAREPAPKRKIRSRDANCERTKGGGWVGYADDDVAINL
jgi:hypothetical protein